MIRRTVIEQSSVLSNKFGKATPFKHLCIDNFLEAEAAESLLRDFPSFDPEKAKNEFGETGRKAVRSDLASISRFYDTFYEYLTSPGFLNAMSGITGIPDLLFDRRMYGGGTHENLNGQGLHAHVDFNYDEEFGWHRRLNLLIYLNKEWREEWGGAIELHSNPRNPDDDSVVAFNPIFNRAVLFETSERSWHGFPHICLPADRKHLSRKCISVYLYTANRPAEEIVPPHGTFYVMDPLPPHIKAGRTLTPEDISEIKDSLKSRDVWIEYYQAQELKQNGTIQTLDAALSRNPLLLFASLMLPAPLKQLLKKLLRRK